MKTLNLIGAGKLGQTLARLWQQQGQFRIQQVLTLSPESAQKACCFINEGNNKNLAQAATSFEALLPADVWLVATPDGSIEDIAATLHAQCNLLNQESIVFHCSGTLGSNILIGDQCSASSVASIHPIHSFASPAKSLDTFSGSYCGYEGGVMALQTLLPAFRAIGAELFEIDGHQKTLYHAASVMACNYLVGLMDASLACFEAAGVSRSQAQQLLLPITHQTLDNALKKSPEEALTGPISRGDLSTVQSHLAKLQPLSKQLSDVYRSLGQQTVQVAEQQEQPASSESLNAIRSLLTNQQNPL